MQGRSRGKFRINRRLRVAARYASCYQRPHGSSRVDGGAPAGRRRDITGMALLGEARLLPERRQRRHSDRHCFDGCCRTALTCSWRFRRASSSVLGDNSRRTPYASSFTVPVRPSARASAPRGSALVKLFNTSPLVTTATVRPSARPMASAAEASGEFTEGKGRFAGPAAARRGLDLRAAGFVFRATPAVRFFFGARRSAPCFVATRFAFDRVFTMKCALQRRLSKRVASS
jgi:hypothetical protein